jgi:hypothetical protein
MKNRTGGNMIQLPLDALDLQHPRLSQPSDKAGHRIGAPAKIRSLGLLIQRQPGRKDHQYLEMAGGRALSYPRSQRTKWFDIFSYIVTPAGDFVKKNLQALFLLVKGVKAIPIIF